VLNASERELTVAAAGHDAASVAEPRLKLIARFLLALFMVAIGIAHFTRTADFVAIVPAYLPSPRMLVLVSGVCEIAGGLAILVPRLRRAAAIGLVLLYIAVFPANVNMALHDIQLPGAHIPTVLLWMRLPFQALFIAWAWWLRRPAPVAAQPVLDGSA
jgi:uncharacterized membrane protein